MRVGSYESHVVRPSVAPMILCLFVASVASATDNMHAVVFAAGQFQIQSVPKPEPQAGEVRIRVRAALVNPADWKLTAHAAPGTLVIPGRDLSGVIDAV